VIHLRSEARTRRAIGTETEDAAADITHGIAMASRRFLAETFYRYGEDGRCFGRLLLRAAGVEVPSRSISMMAGKPLADIASARAEKSQPRPNVDLALEVARPLNWKQAG
jgi:hypothetical protein